MSPARKESEQIRPVPAVGSFERNLATGEGYWSEQLYRMMGYEAGEVEHSFDLFLQHIHPGERSRVRSVITEAHEELREFSFEARYIPRDGTVRYAYAAGLFVVPKGTDEPVMRGTFLDITERKEQELHYRALVDNTPDIIWICDMKLTFTYVSPSVQRVLGYTPEEMIGTQVGDYCDGSTMDHLLQVLQSVLAGGPDGRVVVVEVPLRHRDGWDAIVEISASVIYGGDGTPRSIQGTSRDISERREMLLERERLLRAIQNVAEGVVITDPDGVIEYVNPEFERMTGYAAEDAIGATPKILKSGEHDSAFYKDLWDTITGGRTWQGRFTNRRRDGSLYTEEATISPVQNSERQIVNFVSVKRDITRQIELEGQLHQAQKMEAIGRLAGGVAHDFNNMLNIIMGYARLAQERVAKDDRVYADISKIIRASERSADLTRQLLGFARKQAVLPRIVDLNEVIPGMISMVRRLVGENIELIWVPGETVEPIEIDPSQVHQLLANLIVNARDAIDGVGTIRIQTSIQEFDEEYCARHSGFRPGRYVALTVSDDGAGMDRHTLDHVFEPFFTTKRAAGTGLGLSTIYGIVKQNDGFINVYSEPGLGTTVNLYFPARHGAMVAATPGAVAKRAVGGRETVLLVEDEPALLELSVTTLESLGYRVLQSEQPEKAIEIVRQYDGPIDLVMTDVVMPKMSGGDLWEELQALRPGLKCLFVSGYPADVVQHHGRLRDGVNFLQKPFTVETLSAKLREILDEKSSL